MTGSGLVRDAAQLLATGVLLCAFAMLVPRRPARAAGLLAAQGALLAATAFLHGWLRGEAALFGAVVLVLTGGVGLPVALSTALRRTGEPPGPEPMLRFAAALAVGMALTAAVLLLVLPLLPPGNGGPALAATRQDVGAAACTSLLGLLLTATRRDALGQMLGLCCAAHGAMLAVVTVPGVPPLLPAIGVAALGGGATALLLARRMLDGFGRLDPADLAAGRPPGPAVHDPAAPDPDAPVPVRRRLSGLVRPWKRSS